MDVSSNTSHVGNINPLRYRGYYYDTETGLYYLNSRYYDPETGRFINADKLVADNLSGKNLFIYCGNNPVVNVDESGQLFLRALAGAIVGGIVGGVSRIVTNVVTNRPWNEGVIGAAAGGAVSGAVTVVTGSVTLGSMAGAAVESVTNEVFSYTPAAFVNGQKRKKVTVDNIAESFETVAIDTTAGTIMGTFSSKAGKILTEQIVEDTVVEPIIKSWPKKFLYYAKKELQDSVMPTFVSTGGELFEYNHTQGTEAYVFYGN